MLLNEEEALKLFGDYDIEDIVISIKYYLSIQGSKKYEPLFDKEFRAKYLKNLKDDLKLIDHGGHKDEVQSVWGLRKASSQEECLTCIRALVLNKQKESV